MAKFSHNHTIFTLSNKLNCCIRRTLLISYLTEIRAVTTYCALPMSKLLAATLLHMLRSCHCGSFPTGRQWRSAGALVTWNRTVLYLDTSPHREIDDAGLCGQSLVFAHGVGHASRSRRSTTIYRFKYRPKTDYPLLPPRII
jgi:hypothetical protein